MHLYGARFPLLTARSFLKGTTFSTNDKLPRGTRNESIRKIAVTVISFLNRNLPLLVPFFDWIFLWYFYSSKMRIFGIVHCNRFEFAIKICNSIFKIFEVLLWFCMFSSTTFKFLIVIRLAVVFAVRSWFIEKTLCPWMV